MSTPLKAWRIATEKSADDAARAVGVTLSMWSRWETGSRQIPAHRVLEIEALTGISRHDLRPDVFGKREGEAAA